MNTIHRLVSSSLLLLSLGVATGCPGNEEQPPVADGDGDTEPGTDTGDPLTTSTGSTGPGDATADDTAGETEADTDTGGEQCVEAPTEPVEILNGCTDATCEPFPNTPERLPLLEADGTLPPLP